MGVAEFYARENWRDPWHKVRVVKGVVSVHSGHDIAGAGRAVVPAVDGGTVVATGYSADAGYWVEVRVSATLWQTYTHLYRLEVRVGDVLRRGSKVGRLAGYGDDHGRLWTGPHLHFMAARVAGVIRRRWRSINPQPFIVAALAQPTAPKPPTPSAPVQEEDDMRTAQMHYDEGGKRKRIAFTPGTAWYLEWTEGDDGTIANGLAAAVETGKSIPGTRAMRDAIVAAAERVAAGA